MTRTAIALVALLACAAPAKAAVTITPRDVGAPIVTQDIRDSLAVAWRAHGYRFPACPGGGQPPVYPADLTPEDRSATYYGSAPEPGCAIYLDRQFLSWAPRPLLCWVIVHEWGHNAGLDHEADRAMATYAPSVVPEDSPCFDLPRIDWGHLPAAPTRTATDIRRGPIKGRRLNKRRTKMVGVRITKFGRDEEGVLRARVTPEGGETVAFDRGAGPAGAWVTEPNEEGVRREALPWLAQKLQAQLPATAQKASR